MNKRQLVRFHNECMINNADVLRAAREQLRLAKDQFSLGNFQKVIDHVYEADNILEKELGNDPIARSD